MFKLVFALVFKIHRDPYARSLTYDIYPPDTVQRISKCMRYLHYICAYIVIYNLPMFFQLVFDAFVHL